jgi:hypothetical protein
MTSIYLSHESPPREELLIDESNYDIQDNIDTIIGMKQQENNYTC